MSDVADDVAHKLIIDPSCFLSLVGHAAWAVPPHSWSDGKAIKPNGAAI